MPSPAQVEGRALVASILPEGAAGPNMTIRARRGSGGPGIAYTAWPHPYGGTGGEYRDTVVMPHAHGRHRDAADARLRQLLGRWIEVQTVIDDVLAEVAACDADDDGDVLVDDDMPTPAWRFHCPLPLRRVLDLAGIADDERTILAETSGSFEMGAFRITLHERDHQALPSFAEMRGRGCRTVRRVTIQTDGCIFSQGVNRCYLKLYRAIPSSLQSALVDLPASLLVDLPGIDAAGITILRSGTSLTKGVTEFELSRTFAMMAPPPSLRSDACPK